jgi:uncharacterized protein YeaC (DUF1315 family)
MQRHKTAREIVEYFQEYNLERKQQQSCVQALALVDDQERRESERVFIGGVDAYRQRDDRRGILVPR